ncbi:pilus assembly protein Flp/PilA [Keratinibaculum paraultunense]|uniref:Pilus assembly protein Flp/PilA n=1 Tax=Keratinibaculum paraultunense TaxID=1278232 RepID=A0A4R3KZ34_9FIRM|nr:Flp family type IVb pilin [Keratinibaculum paraultunense]QQY80123.1 Flp family type IVb pilin [Keratinibaculum paraultunense]TCS91556.1 pilus assembly protein Flp/PilA [Keratinibaculum paraultunense]
MLNWLMNEESGQGMVEYGLILALIAIVAALALSPLGTKIADVFKNVEGKLGEITD